MGLGASVFAELVCAWKAKLAPNDDNTLEKRLLSQSNLVRLEWLSDTVYQLMVAA